MINYESELMKYKQLTPFTITADALGETLAGEYLYAVESKIVPRTDSCGNEYSEDVGGRVKLYRMGKFQNTKAYVPEIEVKALQIPHVEFLIEAQENEEEDVIVYEGIAYENTDVPVSTAKAVFSFAKVV